MPATHNLSEIPAKALVSLDTCAGWPEPSSFENDINTKISCAG